MNLKNARIKKLFLQGLSVEQIARKLGLTSVERVEEGIATLRKDFELPLVEDETVNNEIPNK